MAQCFRCNQETQLYEDNVPICLECSHARDAGPRRPLPEHRLNLLLHQEALRATARADAAADAFDTALAAVPRNLPCPCNVRQIRSAFSELFTARREMLRAHTRFQDFFGRRILPEDQKYGRED